MRKHDANDIQKKEEQISIEDSCFFQYCSLVLRQQASSGWIPPACSGLKTASPATQPSPLDSLDVASILKRRFTINSRLRQQICVRTVIRLMKRLERLRTKMPISHLPLWRAGLIN